MGIEQAPTKKGKEAARGLRKAAAAEERKVEAERGQKAPIASKSVPAVRTGKVLAKSNTTNEVGRTLDENRLPPVHSRAIRVGKEGLSIQET